MELMAHPSKARREVDRRAKAVDERDARHVALWQSDEPREQETVRLVCEALLDLRFDDVRCDFDGEVQADVIGDLRQARCPYCGTIHTVEVVEDDDR